MPIVVMLSGPNGAGKTTSSRILLQGPLRVDAFVNADIIAAGLGGTSTRESDFEAGRIMLRRLDELENANADFAFETTLASKTFAGRITRLRSRGYFFALLYLWLPNPEDSIGRVRERVRRGGHHVPDDIIRRRHRRGLQNFFHLYRPISDIWRFYDNSNPSGLRLVASGVRDSERILDHAMWRLALEEAQK